MKMKPTLFLLSSLLLAAQSLRAQTPEVEVVAFHPAPGQFVNTLPQGDATATHADMVAACNETLRDGGLIHLGSFGGNITVKFNAPVKNLRGSDFRILGNGFYAAADPKYGSATLGGSFEPGIVQVGVGDDPATATWYELAGSEYYTTQIHDFKITYYKPTAESGEHHLPYSTFDNYLRWRATWTENGVARDSVGYHMKNSFHRQSYWPLFEQADSLTFTGGKLPNNAIDQSGKGTYWVLYRYGKESYGYVDASLNSDAYSTFDIDWAVDSTGTPVSLDAINFVRVHCAIFQYCGWLGETSTEIAGFENLHLQEGYDDNPIIIPTKQPFTGIAPRYKPSDKPTRLYDLSGRRVAKPSKGIYIKNGIKYLINK